METGELHRLNSIRLSNSKSWTRTNTASFSFSKSFQVEEDEEEALKWAALSKLPTFKRIQVGILEDQEERSHKEIDVRKLGPIEKRHIVDKLVKTAEEDNERFLLKVRRRIDR